MKKRLTLLALIPLLLLGSCGSGTSDVNSNVAVGSIASWSADITANYMLNYNKISFTTDEMSALANGTLYLQQKIVPPAKLTPPEANPTRENYDFTGWYQEAACTTLFDFASSTVSKSVFLYAGWKMTGEETYVEPAYTPKDNIDDTLTTNLKISGLFNTAFTYDTVYLTAGSLKRLSNSPSDVKFALNYSHKTGTTIKSAVFDAAAMTISVVSLNGSNEETDVIKVGDNSSKFALTNSAYEAKAQAFEENDKAAENYHIMLAGSSSIEFWADYAKELSPLVCYSHGIGGTTTADWRTSLLERLVIPYTPKAIVYYVGINDLVNAGKSNDEIISGVEGLLNDTHARLSETHIFYVLINLLPGYYLSYDERIKAIDAALSEYIAPLSWAETVDAGAALLKTDNSGSKVADAAYFRLDNLHMSEYGYVLWSAEIKKALKKWLG